MRPRRLEIEAIGPFGSIVEVDFDELAVEGLFLIHGPTGAGKTSILDAVCFALYGRVPGARGRARSDRSHHAEWGVAPRAALEFDAQGGRYRVERTAAWEAPKTRGNGTTPRPATAVLRRLDEGHAGVIAAKPTEVDAEVERLVGLSAAQFQQVILLPQGKFEKVLQANSKEREELFETLFDTVDFKAATDWLDQEARRRRAHVGSLHQERAVLGDEAIRRGRDVIDVEPSVDPSDTTTIALLLESVSELLESRRAQVTTADEEILAMSAEVSAAARVAEMVVRRDNLRKARSELESRAERVRSERTRLERAEWAEALRASLDEVHHRENVVRKAEHAVQADLLSAREAMARLPVQMPEVIRLDLTSVPPVRALTEATAALAVHRDQLESLEAGAERAVELRSRLEEVHARIDASVEDARLARSRVEEHEAALPALEAALDESRSAAARLGDLAGALEIAETRARAASALAELRPRVEQARRDVESARSRRNDASEAHLAALAKYLEGIAAHLAGRLELDEACLVCGSHDHPNPAEASPDSVSEEEVERLRGEVDAADSELQAVTDAYTDSSGEAVKLSAEAGDLADDPASARRIAKETKAAHSSAVELADAMADRVALLDRVRSAIASDVELIATIENGLSQDEVRRDTLGEQLREVAEKLAAVLPDGVSVEAALAAVQAAVATLERVGDHAADGREAASKLAAAVERAEAEVAASIFEDAETARAAMLDQDRRTELREMIDGHDRRVVEVTAQLAEPDLVDLPDRAPDLERMRTDLEAASFRRDRAVEARTLAESTRGAIEDLLDKHRKVGAELVGAEAEAALYEKVANRCAGRTAPRVPLQRWVLGAYLEEVCAHANRRLATMTAGRYRLLVTRTPAKANQPAGLDLRVHDANTNKEREVSTLSGGETFQASLALALGVADSVEAHTGGVRLEALFIDEGFGSLDAEALELAMDELDGLRAGGRMVGVISHVPRLRERIRIGAEVHKGEAGSTVTVGEVAVP
ncbi:MAG: SMC family ATPase [Acidimicrobiales bacterium]|nr:SMC family ATPase [Acidimicrobiales bacterium]